MVRALGCVGSTCSSGLLLPAVPNPLSVLKASAVAGLVTNAVTVVCKVSAALFGHLEAVQVVQAPPAEATDVVSEPKPDGPFATLEPKYALSILRRRSRTSP